LATQAGENNQGKGANGQFEKTVGPDNQKADSFTRTRPESVDDLHCFCFYRDFSSFFYPTVNPQA
jgi:hypothetical protein